MHIVGLLFLSFSQVKHDYPRTFLQVPLSVLPYFRFLSEEAQRNVMSQLIDNFQTAAITKRGNGSNAPASGAASSSAAATSPEALEFMRSPTFAKVYDFVCFVSSWCSSLIE